MKQLLGLLLVCVLQVTQAQIKVACVGNSITYGYGIKGRDSLSYPGQLQKILGSDWQIGNFGHSGATMLKSGDRPYWDQDAYKDALDFGADVVIIMLGTNDSKPQNWYENELNFISDYKEMIKSFKAQNRRIKVYICRPIPVVHTTWGIRKGVVEDEIPKLLDGMSADLGINMIDLYTPLKDKPALLPDNIHPDTEGSRIMAETVADVLVANQADILNRMSK